MSISEVIKSMIASGYRNAMYGSTEITENTRVFEKPILRDNNIVLHTVSIYEDYQGVGTLIIIGNHKFFFGCTAFLENMNETLFESLIIKD